jgi:Rha family phage regulatory protein
MQKSIQNNTNSLVSLSSDNQIVTTSKNIADLFGKRHADVLRDIDNTIPFLSEEYRACNFAFTIESVAMPKGAKRQDRICELTKNGAIILIMGYTGEKAMQFKEAYINAFDAMANNLQSIKDSKYIELETTNKQLCNVISKYENQITPAQAKTLKKAVELKAKGCKKAYSFIYHAIYDKFDIPEYKALPIIKYDECITYITNLFIPADITKLGIKDVDNMPATNIFKEHLDAFVIELLNDLKRITNSFFRLQDDKEFQKHQIDTKLLVLKTIWQMNMA